MRKCLTCGQYFQTWLQVKDHLEKVHNNRLYSRQYEKRVAYAVEQDGRIVRFDKPSVKGKTQQ